MRVFILLCLLLLPLHAMAQEDDRDYLTAFLEDNLSGAGRKVTITGFKGALSSRATIEQIAIADDDGIWLTLDSVVLDWSRSALLGGRVSVNELTVDEITLDRLPISEPSPPSPEAPGFALPELPVSIEIGRIAAKSIMIGADVAGLPMQGELEAALSLIDGEGRANLMLNRIDDAPAGWIRLDASYNTATRRLAIDLDLKEDANGVAANLLDIPGKPAVELTIKGDDPIDDFTAAVRLASDGAERLVGKVTLQAPEGGVQHFSADLGGDLAPLFVPEYAAFFGSDVRLQTVGTKAQDGRLDLQSLSVQTHALSLTGSLVLAADRLPEHFTLTGRLGLPDGSPVLLPLTSEQRTFIGRADLAFNFDAAKDEGWHGKINIAGLRRDDFAADNLQVTGAGRIARQTGHPVVAATLLFDARGLMPTDPGLAAALGRSVSGEAALQWQQGDEALSLPRLVLNGENYGLTANGRIEGLSSGLTLTGQVALRADDLSRAATLAGRPLGGAVNATASGSASLLAGSFDLETQISANDLHIGQTEVDRLLRGKSKIDLSARRGAEGLEIRKLDIAAGSLTAHASGQLATTASTLTADLDFADLSVMGEQYGGALKGRARFTGTVDAGDLTFDAEGNALSIGQPETDRLLQGRSLVSLHAGLAGDAVTLHRLHITAATLDATASGRYADKGSDITTDLVFTDLSVLGGPYRGALTANAQFTGTPQDGHLTIEGRADDLAIGQREADRLLRGQSTLSATLDLQAGQIRIDHATLQNPQLQAEATGSIKADTRRVEFSAKLVNLADILPEFPGALTVTGSAEEDTQGYQVDLVGKGPGQIDATVAGRISADFRQADLRLIGSAQAGLANAFLVPRAVSGPLRFDLRLNGPLVPNSLSGQVRLTDARVSDPGLPFALEGLNATADMSAGQAQIEANAAISTGGRLRLSGTTGMAAPYNGDLRVEIERAIIKDPQLYKTRLNGTATVVGPLTGGALISGKINLRETELRIPSTGFGNIGTLPDLRHINEPAAVRATRARAGLIARTDEPGRSGRPFRLDLTINSPTRLFIRGRGLDAELGGSLRLTGTTDAIVPSGAFNLIRGRLDILGKRLDLAQALLQLEGDFDPYIDVLASNESDDIISSVRISGKATEPQVSFVSVPELPEEEVLARLLFGRDLTSLSPLQAAQLASAVATLAGRGGEGVVSKLRQGFGLDDLDLATDARGETTVKAGKYVSRKLYTEVEVDQRGQSQINLNLDISRSLTLRGSTRSDGQTGIGVFLKKDY